MTVRVCVFFFSIKTEKTFPSELDLTGVVQRLCEHALLFAQVQKVGAQGEDIEAARALISDQARHLCELKSVASQLQDKLRLQDQELTSLGEDLGKRDKELLDVREALKQAMARLEERDQEVAKHVAHLIKLKERYETNDTTFRQVDSALRVSRTHSSTIEKELSETKLAGAALKVTFWLSMLRLRGVWWWGVGILGLLGVTVVFVCVFHRWKSQSQ